MTTNNEIVIPLSKAKMFRTLIGAILFVAIGVWMVMHPAGAANSHRMYPSALVFSVGLASVIFFGFCAIFIVKKLLDTSPGLIINAEGIFDNSSGVAVGLIPWSEILGLREHVVANQKFIVILVNSPESYISRQNNALKKIALERSLKSSGSPIAISAISLKMCYKELYQIIESELEIRREPARDNG